MNIFKKIIQKIKKPSVQKKLGNADIIIDEGEKLNRQQRKQRFDDWYKSRK
jgi:hypothetical protein